jgi:hypothetical protein
VIDLPNLPWLPRKNLRRDGGARQSQTASTCRLAGHSSGSKLDERDVRRLAKAARASCAHPESGGRRSCQTLLGLACHAALLHASAQSSSRHHGQFRLQTAACLWRLPGEESVCNARSPASPTKSSARVRSNSHIEPFHPQRELCKGLLVGEGARATARAGERQKERFTAGRA